MNIKVNISINNTIVLYSKNTNCYEIFKLNFFEQDNLKVNFAKMRLITIINYCRLPT